MYKILTKGIIGGITIVIGFSFSTEKLGEKTINHRYDHIPDNLIGEDSKQNKGYKNRTKKGPLNIERFEKIEKIKKRKKEIEEINTKILKIVSDSLKDKYHSSGKRKNTKYDQNTINKICKYHQKICNTIKINTKLGISTKVKYKSLIIYLVKKHEKILKNKNIKDNLGKIKIIKQNGKRGYAGSKNLIMNIKNISKFQEFREVFTHELAHIIDLGILKGDSGIMHKKFTEFGNEVFHTNDPSIDFYKISWLSENTRKAGEDRENFVSGYAMSDPFEDFSETANMYLNHFGTFKKMKNNNYNLKRKFKFMKRLFGKKYIKYDKENKEKLSSNPQRRPWDTTNIN